MKSTVTVQLETSTLLKLINRLSELGGTQDVSEGVSSAIEFWLAEQAKLATGCDPASVRGYQWKTLFLPEGTVLRSWSYGDHNYARVEGDQIIHEGKPVSPNQFAQSFARTTRNAWTDLYIRRPGDKRFTMACRLRQQLAEQAANPADPAPPPGVPTTIPETTVMALIAAMQAQAQAQPHQASPQAGHQEAPSAPPRDPTPGLGWTLPERRSMRFRLEDVAFD
ncbi:hypothetical protein NHH88_09195 [Oxalobacteraceae bacterium OTU3CAMAD1]|nr:hypothetical protein NHH88_09195 [Oxalobacteraceae bacterium OTU3CAMAD1]